jgi:hypothetical protein
MLNTPALTDRQTVPRTGLLRSAGGKMHGVDVDALMESLSVFFRRANSRNLADSGVSVVNHAPAEAVEIADWLITVAAL